MHTSMQDQMGHHVELEKVPTKIVSLVPSQTELLCDLGLEKQLAGITKFCVHPFHLRAGKVTVGGTKKVDFQKIRALDPDIIICNKEENTAEMVAALRDICPVWVTDVKSIADNCKMIADFGQLFNKRTEAQKWIGKIEFARADFEKSVSDKPYRKCVYFIWKNPWMVAGSDNFINELLRLNRFENIYQTGRYPEIALKDLRSDGDPELVLLSSEPYPFKAEDAFEIGRHTHHAKTLFVDGEMFSWYGSRLVKAFGYFKQLQQRLS